jgi:hypothetical protein
MAETNFIAKSSPGGEGTGDLWGAWRVYEKCPNTWQLNSLNGNQVGELNSRVQFLADPM